MGLPGSAGDLVLPDIDISWLEPTRLNIQVGQQADLLQAWSSAQVCTMYCCKTINLCHLFGAMQRAHAVYKTCVSN